MARRGVRLLAVLLLVASPRAAFAELGGDAASIDADRIRMQGALLRITRVRGAGALGLDADAFTVHEVQSSTGTAVREYVSPSGKVFAVAWTGPWMPDMRQLLGTYFDRYQRAAADTRRTRRGHGPLAIDDGELVVRSAGHPRAFSGVVAVPRLTPAGVRAEQIR